MEFSTLKHMKLISWNVNGIRACFNKGAFFEFLETHDPECLFIQETKLQLDQVPPELENPMGYYCDWSCAEKKGYSGVAIFTKQKPIQIFKEIGMETFDREGRVIGAEFETHIAFGIYFPNGQSSPERLQYKLDFYDALFNYLEELKNFYKKPIFVSGDYNTAHKEIDLARPKENEGISGFLPIEREWLDKIIETHGYVDTFREFVTEPDQYSWWTYRANARQRNIGWRIDYVFSDKDGLAQVSDAYILPEVKGSDHCPVGVTLSHG